MNRRAILKAVEVMDASLGFSKTASSDSSVLQQIDDAFIKIADENNREGFNFKVANLMSDVISALGLGDVIDSEDFIRKTATAELVYDKLASSNNLQERDMAELAKMHINALFMKVAQIAAEHPEEGPGEYAGGAPHPAIMGIGGLMSLGLKAPEYQRRAEKYKNIAMYGIPVALGIGATLPYLTDKILGK